MRADAKNKYDKFAVAVYRNRVMIGHVPRSDNKHISRLLRQGANVDCKVTASNIEEETWNMLKVKVHL